MNYKTDLIVGINHVAKVVVERNKETKVDQKWNSRHYGKNIAMEEGFQLCFTFETVLKQFKMQFSALILKKA